MSALPRPYTYDDLRAAEDDAKRHEIVDGELIELTPPVTMHQRLLRHLLVLLDVFVTARHLGEVFAVPYDVILSAHDVVQPDLLFVGRDRRHIIGVDNIVGAPDLTIEILSPSTRVPDQIRKARVCAAPGFRESWLVDPEERSILVNVLRNGRYEPIALNGATFRSAGLPDLEIDVAALFAEAA